MMSEAYASWAPDESIWSPWVKPVLFTEQAALHASRGSTALDAPAYPIDRLPTGGADAFVIVDRPGPESVAFGLALAQRGYRPVPLFNGLPAVMGLVPVDPVIAALLDGAPRLAQVRLRPDAPPAFLLDSRRLTGMPLPGTYDNRWVVVPEDFPSGNRLLAAGLRRCVLLTDDWVRDLPHVLLRYRRAGIALLEAGAGGGLSEHVPQRPDWFGALFARAMVAAGLRRSSAGGFGGAIPVPSEGGYG